MIEVNNLSYKYPSEDLIRFPDFQVEPAKSCLILGNSGVGKTTLLHLLAGLMKPKDGHVRIHDVILGNLSGRKLDQFRGQNIGIIFQKNHFVSALSVLDNLLLSQKLSGEKPNAQLAKNILDQLNIGHYGRKLTNALSEGERQRVSIARSLINKPKLILADEPTSALDDENCQAVYELLKSQAEEIGASLIIVTHDGRLKELIDKKVMLEKVNTNV